MMVSSAWIAPSGDVSSTLSGVVLFISLNSYLYRRFKKYLSSASNGIIIWLYGVTWNVTRAKFAISFSLTRLILSLIFMIKMFCWACVSSMSLLRIMNWMELSYVNLSKFIQKNTYLNIETKFIKEPVMKGFFKIWLMISWRYSLHDFGASDSYVIIFESFRDSNFRQIGKMSL